MVEYGLDLAIECGASPVLGPLFKRLSGAPDVVVVSDYAGVAKLHNAVLA